jgi:hypothetical protein
MILMVKILLSIPKGLSRNGDFSSKKRPFSTANISKKKADFDLRPPPMENMNLLLAAYTQFRGCTDERLAQKIHLK